MMRSFDIKEASVQSANAPLAKESIFISTTNMADTFEVQYAVTVIRDWLDGSSATILRKDSLTISGNHQLSQLWEELLSLLVDLANGDHPCEEEQELELEND